MGSMSRPRHLLGVLLVLVLTTSGTLRGLCFMPGTGEVGPRDAHACCKKGWTAGAPECCMAGAADEEPARTSVPAAIGPPAAIRIGILVPPSESYRGTALAPGTRAHSPPGPAPLRI
jgi:hypothetical protein